MAILVFVLDQVTKFLVLANLEPFVPISLTSFLNFTLVFNKGAAFGMLSSVDIDVNTFFMIFNLCVLVFLIYVMWKVFPARSQSSTGLWLIAAGAIGNVADRFLHGHVVDFLDFHYAGWHFATFNVADSSISIGAVLIIMEMVNLRVLFRKG